MTTSNIAQPKLVKEQMDAVAVLAACYGVACSLSAIGEVLNEDLPEDLFPKTHEVIESFEETFIAEFEAYYKDNVEVTNEQ